MTLALGSRKVKMCLRNKYSVFVLNFNYDSNQSFSRPQFRIQADMHKFFKQIFVFFKSVIQARKGSPKFQWSPFFYTFFDANNGRRNSEIWLRFRINLTYFIADTDDGANCFLNHWLRAACTLYTCAGGRWREDEPGPGRGHQGGPAHRAGRGQDPTLYRYISMKL